MVAYDKIAETEERRENPRTGANIFSILSFWWLKETFYTGNKRPLLNEDLFPLLEEDKCQNATENLQHLWDEKISKHPPGKIVDTRTGFPRKLFPWERCGGGYNLLSALVQLHAWYDYALVFLFALLSALGNVLQPFFLSLLLPELLQPSRDDRLAYAYAGGICLSSSLRVLATNQFVYRSWTIPLRWKSAVVGLIYKKVLGFNQSQLSYISSGRVMNLIAGDLQRIDPFMYSVGSFVRAVFEASWVSFLIAYLFGWKALVGLLVLLSLAVLYGIMGVACASLRLRIAAFTDKRLRLMNNIIMGIRTVKMNAWEWLFRERVLQTRRAKIRLIRLKSAILAIISALMYSSLPVTVITSLVTLSASGTELTTYNMFMILSLYGTIRVTVCWHIAQISISLGDFSSSVRRIQLFLETFDSSAKKLLHQSFCDDNDNDHNADKNHFGMKQSDIKDNDERSRRVNISMKNVVCTWTGNWKSPTINSVSLTMNDDDMVFVTGPVGSGKTSILLTLLGELTVYKGHVTTCGKIAYVAQQSWVFSSTVQENILFGQPFDTRRYNMVIEACALLEDIKAFPDGHMTMIGERGIVLSGGQRARIGLARAVYSDADIYLLDDPLSAVDAKVGKHIFERCLNGALSKKLRPRLVVTHSLQYLKNEESIVLINEGSILLDKGTYRDLLKFESVVLEAGKRNSRDLDEVKSLSITKRTKDFKVVEDAYGLDTAEEERLAGSVNWRSYWDYIRAGISVKLLLLLATFFIIVQGSLVAPDWWLLQMSSLSPEQRDDSRNFHIYGGLVCTALLLFITRALLLFQTLVNSSNRLHDRMTIAILKAPVLFYDTNPVGRIMNRFSGDITVLDELLPYVFVDTIQLVLYSVGILIFTSTLNPWIIFAVAPLLIVFFMVGQHFNKTFRELRRLEALNRSPVLSHFSDTLEGLATIRAYKKETSFLQELFRHQDTHIETCFMLKAAPRWLSIRLDALSVTFTAAVAFLAIAAQSSPGVTALSLVYTLQLTVDVSQYGVIQYSETESYMTSAERVITYTRIQPEPGYQNQSQPHANWPDRGQVKLQKLELVYYNGGPKVLKDVSFTINPREKVGIVGRTGAGKSSLVSAVFRMPDPSGDVIVDDVKIAEINLQRARGVMSVITQDPILFNGSLRMNLDPFEKHHDQEIWTVLEEANLKALEEKLPNQLFEEIKEGGANFSVGEKQLICLARALLQRNRVMVLDEATANLDYKMDQLIQETIRRKFKDCTVITIANRVNTIIDYDRVLVLDNGKVVEFDQPDKLLQNAGGQFWKLYHQC